MKLKTIIGFVFLMTIFAGCGIKSEQYNPEAFEHDIKEFNEEERKKINFMVMAANVDGMEKRINAMTYGEIIELYDKWEEDGTVKKYEGAIEETNFNIDSFFSSLKENKKAVIPIEKLAFYHHDNFIRCRKTFHKKWFWISGVVDEIGESDTKVPTIRFKVKNHYLLYGIKAFVSGDKFIEGVTLKNEVGVDRLHKGDRIVVFGECQIEENGLFIYHAIVSQGGDENLLNTMKKGNTRNDTLVNQQSKLVNYRLEVYVDQSTSNPENINIRIINNNEFKINKAVVKIDFIDKKMESIYDTREIVFENILPDSYKLITIPFEDFQQFYTENKVVSVQY